MANNKLVRAAFHEAGHAAIAHAYHLEIDTIEIHADGSGEIIYGKDEFSYPEFEPWTLATLAGGNLRIRENIF